LGFKNHHFGYLIAAHQTNAQIEAFSGRITSTARGMQTIVSLPHKRIKNAESKPIKSSNVINSYRKRKFQKGPFLVYGAVALVIIGVIMLVVWLASPANRSERCLRPTLPPQP
jgi:hypothetical protein